MILSAVMMLDHVDETDMAKGIRDAISGVVADGKVRCYDMMKMPGREDVVTRGAASTTQMVDAILERL
jgi:isocitrate/isopropylmalate dehydrogenase